MNRDYTYEIFMEQHGRSDKANAACNRNPDFREGYDTACATEGYNPRIVETVELQHRKEYGYGTPESFAEWQLGFHAALCHLHHGKQAGCKQKRRWGNPFGIHPGHPGYPGCDRT